MHELFESSHSIPRLLVVLCKSAQSSIFKCVCVCLHSVPILASIKPALCFCYECKSSCWILCLLYVFSLAANVFAECKMAQYPGGPAVRRGPRDTPLPFHTCCCWHACFRCSQTAKHSTQDDDACSGKWRVWPFHLFEPWNSHFEQKTFSFYTKYFFVRLLDYSFWFRLFFYKFLCLYLTLGM